MASPPSGMIHAAVKPLSVLVSTAGFILATVIRAAVAASNPAGVIAVSAPAAFARRRRRWGWRRRNSRRRAAACARAEDSAPGHSVSEPATAAAVIAAATRSGIITAARRFRTRTAKQAVRRTTAPSPAFAAPTRLARNISRGCHDCCVEIVSGSPASAIPAAASVTPVPYAPAIAARTWIFRYR